MNLAIYITGHGYGHLTRTLEICKKLREIDPSVRLHTRTPFPLPHISEALTFEPDSHNKVRLDIGLAQKDSLRWDLEESLQRLEWFYGPEGDRQVEMEARWLETNRIDAALVDIPPRAFEACRLAGVPAYGSTNFSWDWIWRDLTELDRRFAPYADKASAAYNTCTTLYRTVMSDGLDAFPVQEEVPLVARISQRDPHDVRRLMEFPEGKILVMLSFGGEGLKDIQLPNRSVHDRFQFLVTEPIDDPGPPYRYIPNAEFREKELRYCDLVKAVDIVMSKPGYSTVAECAANETAMVYTDRQRFAEYPVVKAYIEQYLVNAYVPRDRLTAGHWAGALNRLADRMPFHYPPNRIDGAEVVAGKLHAALQAGS